MPLNPIAKPKMIEWFRKIPEELKTKEYYKINDHARGLESLSEIFMEDDEWTKELFESSIILSYISLYFLRADEPIPEEKIEKVMPLFKKYFELIESAINTDDWLKYHKAFRDLTYEVDKLF